MRHGIFGKIFIGFIILAVLLSAGVYFYAKPFILARAQKELHKIFKESSIQGLKITPDYTEFQNIKIREKNFDADIKKARAYYDLRSILNKKINKIEAIDADLNFYKDDIKIKAKASLELDMATNTIDYIKLNVSSCKTNLFEIQGLSLNASQGKNTGEFYIRSINYNKLKLADVVGKSELKEKLLRINPLSVSFLGGSVKGEFSITLDEVLDYSLKLDTQGMEIEKLVNEMEFNEKFDMTGRLAGAFSLSGKGEEIKDMKGDFTTGAQGGILIIKDKTFLENVAKQSNQPLDILVESFKNYNYNNGVVKLFMENGNITLDLKLDGTSGKRNLVIVLHDFK
ncbi:MAG: YdbH domain-containing protein [Candidatus Omnitrophota bacterium]|nr:YdbH domain-containing protein [Candidatus Omnitrophota bacterium]